MPPPNGYPFLNEKEPLIHIRRYIKQICCKKSLLATVFSVHVKMCGVFPAAEQEQAGEEGSSVIY